MGERREGPVRLSVEACHLSLADLGINRLRRVGGGSLRSDLAVEDALLEPQPGLLVIEGCAVLPLGKIRMTDPRITVAESVSEVSPGILRAGPCQDVSNVEIFGECHHVW